jgi:hypothetical protein
LDARDTKEKIKAVLDKVTSDYVPDQTLRELRELTRKASAWAMAKAIGEQVVPPGEATVQYRELSAKLEKQGLFVVPVGELEGFDKSVGGEGPAWIGQVMQKDLAKIPPLILQDDLFRKLSPKSAERSASARHRSMFNAARTRYERR